MLNNSVVFDTSTLLAATIWRGSPFHCLRLAWSGKILSVTCRSILAEFEMMLRHRRNLTSTDANRVVAEVRAFSRLVTIGNVLQMVSADPSDDKILECAVVGGANYIVTCDHNHLLPLVRYHGIALVSPTTFLATMSTW